MGQMSLLGMVMQGEKYDISSGPVETPLVLTINHTSIRIKVMTANITHDPVMSSWLHSTAMPRQQPLLMKTVTYQPRSVVLVFLISAKPEAGTSHLVRYRSQTLNNRNHMPRFHGEADECNSAELITQPYRTYGHKL